MTVKEQLEAEIIDLEARAAAAKEKLSSLPEEVLSLTTEVWDKIKAFFVVQ